MSYAIARIALVLAILGPPGAALAQGEDESTLGIKGYSPVSYFDHDRAEKGSPEYTVVHNERVYRLTDADQKARFEADPERYAPVFPNHCPYSLTLGRPARIDPTNFKIVDGNLLLFHRSEDMDGLEEWEQSDADDEELLERAQARYELFRF